MSYTFISIGDFNNNLLLAVESIGTEKVTLVINIPLTPTAVYILVPENIILMFVDTGALNLSEETIIEVYSPSNITAPSRMQIKTGDGVLKFTKGGEVEMGWWGYKTPFPEPPTGPFGNSYLQEAIDSLKDTTGGGIVNVPSAKIYLQQNVPVYARSKVSLRGKGYTSRLLIAPNSAPPPPDPPPFPLPPPITETMLILEDVEDMFIEQLTFSGGNTNESGQLELRGGTNTGPGGCKNIRIEHCTFEGGWSSIWSRPGDGNTNEHIDIFNNHFNTGKHQLYLGSSGTDPETNRYITLISNHFKTQGSVGSDAIKLRKHLQDVLIQNNVMQGTSGSSGDGIDMFASGDRISVIGNVIEGFGVNGIDIKTDDQGYPPAWYGKNRQVLIKSNIIRNNDERGVKVVTYGTIPTGDWPYLVEIVDNQIYNNKGTGILCGGKYIGVIGNHVYENGQDTNANNGGIRVEGHDAISICSEYISIIGNLVVDNGNASSPRNFGLLVTNAVKHCQIFDNLAFSKPKGPNDLYLLQDSGIIVSAGAQEVSLKNNRCKGHNPGQDLLIYKGAGVVGELVSCTIGELSLNTDERPIFVTPSSICLLPAKLVNADNVTNNITLEVQDPNSPTPTLLRFNQSTINQFAPVTLENPLPSSPTAPPEKLLPKGTTLSFKKTDSGSSALTEARLILHYVTY